jgi:biopolymer transport protein ExbB
MANTTTPPKANKQGSGAGFPPAIVIPLLLVVAYCLYRIVMGNPANFQGTPPASSGIYGALFPARGEPQTGNFLGVVYKGGFIVPLLMTMLMTAIVFSIERYLTIGKAAGKGSVDQFVRTIQGYLQNNDTQSAMAACDKQRGSVANVVRSGLQKYADMEHESGMDRDQKVIAIENEVEKATSLELPMLEKNLNILATLAPTATLLGLIGTVLGMIRAFAGLANSGSPDSAALATGISEALINTAFGISTSFIAIIMYNFFTGKIDKLTYSIDEIGYSLSQMFVANHKK